MTKYATVRFDSEKNKHVVLCDGKRISEHDKKEDAFLACRKCNIKIRKGNG